MDFDPSEMLAKPLMAHLATNSPDGPRDSPVWFLWENGAIWLIGTNEDSFPARLGAEPRCAIGIVEFDVVRGILLHVGIRGHAVFSPWTRRGFTGCSNAIWVRRHRNGTPGSGLTSSIR